MLIKLIWFTKFTRSCPDSTGSPNLPDPDSSGYYWVAFGGTNKTIGEWDLKATDYEQFPVKHSQLIKALAYSSCGGMIATGSFDMSILLWDVGTKSCLRIFTGHHGVINSIAYSPDDKQLVTGSNDLTVRVWNVETGECIKILQHKKPVSSVAYSPKHLPKDAVIDLTKDSPENLPECLPRALQIATASSTTIQIWDSASGECQTEFQNYGSALDISWSETHKGDFLVTGGDDKLVRSWKLKKTQDSQHKIYLAWCSTPHELTFTSADIHETQGLSKLGIQLLRQQGATHITLKNTAKKVMQACSTISGFTCMVKKDILERPHETKGTLDRSQEAQGTPEESQKTKGILDRSQEVQSSTD
ncbi:hypothetical protein BGZ79_005087 [Entomortierella chlamydospora]|nr:hypothetical protein BGZ79_005087 [Entomortierella chlamydospora]